MAGKMTREQMIDEAVREYMEYLRDNGWAPKAWAAAMLWHPWLRTHYVSAIRFAYWKIKTEQEFLSR